MGKTPVKPVWKRFRRPSGFSVSMVMALLLTMVAVALAGSAALAEPAGPGQTGGASAACNPEIAISSADPRWATYEDYLKRDLTVDESIQNLGSCSSCSLRIESILSDSGVSTLTPTPMEMGAMPTASTSTVTVRFHLPAGVAKFRTRMIASCQEFPDPAPAADPGTVSIDPEFAFANEGCPEGPVPGQDGRTLPEDQRYGARRFTVTLTEQNGSPAAGKAVKWYLDNETQFRVLESTQVTDAAGQAYAVVTPPQYFICVAPYFDRGETGVMARSGFGDAQASFIYTRCAPPGETPPWAAEAA